MSAPQPPKETTYNHTKKSPFFATENPEDPDAVASMRLRQAQFEIFGHFADAHFGAIASKDHDLELANLGTSTGMTKPDVERAVYGYMALRRLPQLRELQRATFRLDAKRLATIDDFIRPFDDQAESEAFTLIDDALVTLFTPTFTNESLPTPTAITRRLNQLLADIDSAAAHDAKKRKDREKKKNIGPGQCDIESGPCSTMGQWWMNLTMDTASMAVAQANIEATAREHKLTQSEAVYKLLTGEIEPVADVRIYAYLRTLPTGEVDKTAPAFIPGFGWTDATGTAVVHNLLGADAQQKIADFLDVDSGATHTVDGYVAPEKVRAYVRGRDGSCIFPGCDRDAWECQLDHRVPYAEGGQTNADNLYCLCQKHHNVKTDRRAFYIPDPVSGEIVWLFSNGTYARVRPNGFLHSQITPTDPRWKSTLADVEERNRKKARFFARGHRILDAYEEHFKYERCLAELTALEVEYGMEFPFHPQPFPPEPPADPEEIVPEYAEERAEEVVPE